MLCVRVARSMVILLRSFITAVASRVRGIGMGVEVVRVRRRNVRSG